MFLPNGDVLKDQHHPKFGRRGVSGSLPRFFFFFEKMILDDIRYNIQISEETPRENLVI